MSTVNYSVPDDVKEAFNRTFDGQNKSAVIADLMRKAVKDAEDLRIRRARSREAFRILTEDRKNRPTLTDDEFRRLREEMRT